VEVPTQELTIEVQPPPQEAFSVEYVAADTALLEPKPDNPHPEEEEDFGWGSFTSKKGKKKGKKTVGFLDVIEEPAPEPEPAFNNDDWSWGTMTKKPKKKKGQSSVEVEEPKTGEAPPLPTPSESELVIEDDAWDTWGTFSTKGKKKKSKVTDVSVELAPQPIVGYNTWSFSTREEKPIPEPQDEAIEDEWSSLWQSKRTKNGRKAVSKMPVLEESSTAKEPGGQILEVPPTPETVEYQTTASSAETTTRTPQPQITRRGQTVVFTIQYPNEISNNPVQVMVTLTDNSRAAIFEAVNSYLDSKSILTVREGQRKLEIKSGVGKNGDVDLSALEDSMWPEYLEYFRQYTRLPELTVDVVDC
jgi:hypothetical protein